MILAFSLSLLLQFPTDTVRVSVEEALNRARTDNPSLQAEFAEARSASADALKATRAFLPTVRADVQGTRTTDPVGVFGLKLRQSQFGNQDLAIDALNDPAAFGGFASSLTVELPVFAPEGLFGFRAAQGAAEARGAQAHRVAGATAFFVIQGYWDARLAAGRVEALDAAVAAAGAHARAAGALREQGVVTGLDERLARLRRSEIEVRLVEAAAEAENALSRLKALLAIPESTPIQLTDSLSDSPSESCPESTACQVEERGDIRALEAGVDAAQSARKSAWGAQLPQIIAFGALTHHGANSPWSSGSGHWAVGIGLRWNVFPGLGGVAAIRQANAQAEAVQSRLEAAERQAAVEVQSAERRLAAAIQAAQIAADAAAEAELALEQANQRYRTGTAPITELLDVQAVSTNAALSRLSARRNLFVAQAALEFAYGVLDR